MARKDTIAEESWRCQTWQNGRCIYESGSTTEALARAVYAASDFGPEAFRVLLQVRRAGKSHYETVDEHKHHGGSEEADGRIDVMTPKEAWELYVGSQSPHEFAELSEGDVDRAVRDYVCGCQTCEDLTALERAHVAHLLRQHIERNQ
jgi:hypothetical protein